jgi:F0F1-type ATP synthase epsilon subunit
LKVLDCLVLNPREIVFEGKASSIIVPGEEGVFEVISFHKRILSRLLCGNVFVDDKNYRIRRGIIKVDQNKVTIIIEQDEQPGM